MSTQPTTTQTNTTPKGWAIPSVGVNPHDRDGRVPYGLQIEYRKQVILNNWSKSNEELGSFLGVTSGSISRLRKMLKSRSEFLEIAMEDYIKHRSSSSIPDTVKFQMAAKMIGLLLEQKTEIQGSSVTIKVVESVPRTDSDVKPNHEDTQIRE